MAGQEIVVGGSTEPTQEQAAAALEAAAATAPTTEAEATQQLEAENQTSTTPQRPDNVPEKFWDAEKGEVNLDAVLQANSELEKKLGAPKDAPADTTAEKPEGDAGGDTEEGKGDEANPVEVYNALADNYDKNGSLSEEDYVSAEKAGWSREQVDAYVAGQEALAEKATASIYEAGGGQEATNSMLTWAKTGLDAPTIERLNTAFGSGNTEAAVAAMTELKGAYEKANGPVDGSLITGKSSGSNPGGRYESMAEMQVDMADPRYTKDPAFRSKVEDKIARSNIF